ncbi:MAG TPA: hypothetical protein VFC44_05750 [Candidatus Saccharimonadales bacterium]|nr:hypothetical protein [Candidatus Saccharimonadales bacterium]
MIKALRVNHADVINALQTREFEKWSEEQIKQGLAALHKANSTEQASYFNVLIGTLNAELETRERSRFSKQSLDQLEAARENVDQGNRIVGRLDQHHSTHQSILTWSKAGAIAAIVAALTGIICVWPEMVRGFNWVFHGDNGGKSSERLQSTIAPQPISTPTQETASSSLANPTRASATNQAKPPEPPQQ